VKTRTLRGIVPTLLQPDLTPPTTAAPTETALDLL
jgi:hypothetical protein